MSKNPARLNRLETSLTPAQAMLLHVQDDLKNASLLEEARWLVDLPKAEHPLLRFPDQLEDAVRQAANGASKGFLNRRISQAHKSFLFRYFLQRQLNQSAVIVMQRLEPRLALASLQLRRLLEWLSLHEDVVEVRRELEEARNEAKDRVTKAQLHNLLAPLRKWSLCGLPEPQEEAETVCRPVDVDFRAEVRSWMALMEGIVLEIETFLASEDWIERRLFNGEKVLYRQTDTNLEILLETIEILVNVANEELSEERLGLAGLDLVGGPRESNQVDPLSLVRCRNAARSSHPSLTKVLLDKSRVDVLDLMGQETEELIRQNLV